MINGLTRKNLKAELANEQKLCVVQFTTEWNGVSHIIEPMLRDLSKQFRDQVSFYTVDLDQEKGIEQEYGIMEIPTILLFKAGNIVDHVIGLTSKQMLAEKIEKAIAANKKNAEK